MPVTEQNTWYDLCADHVNVTYQLLATKALKFSNIYPTRCNVTKFILSGNCSTCFGWYHHTSSGAQTTVSTASGICQTVIASIVIGSNNGLTNARCRYSCLSFL